MSPFYIEVMSMLHKNYIFLEVDSVDDLCSILNISKGYLNYILFVKEKNYITFEIPKKNGGVRKISAPTTELKVIQQRLATLLYNCYDFLDVQHGFIKNRSCVTNASQHVGKRFVLNIDLENFFDTIHFGRVCGMFMGKPFNFNRHLATFLAKIVCDDGKLPQGAPTSPIISNIICYQMDKELEHLSKKNRCIYSRYADDITISTNSDKFPLQIAYKQSNEIVLSNRLIEIINGGYSTGFKVNNAKTKLSKNMLRQEVTGVIVNTKLNLNKKYIKEVRAMLDSIKKHGFIITAQKNFKNLQFVTEKDAKYKMFNFLQGKLNYLKMVRNYNDKVFLKYAKEFNELFNVELFDVDSILEIQQYTEDRCFVLQSEAEDSQGTAFLIKNNILYTSTHILINKTTVKDFIYDENDNQYLRQFPIIPNDGKLPFFYLKNKASKCFLNFKLDENNYKTDILCIKDINFNSKFFKVSKDKLKMGDTVYLVGYPGFVDFDRTSISIIETKIIGKGTFLGREFLVTKDSPRHGMSGGPVLNKKREVVGIVYAGADLDDDYSSDKVGFISLV